MLESPASCHFRFHVFGSFAPFTAILIRFSVPLHQFSIYRPLVVRVKILWLFGEEDYVQEVSAMNIFFLIKKEDGEGVELVTPPLDAGDILEG